MKSLVFAFALLGCAYSASAQKGELSTAKTNYEKYIALKDAGSLVLALPSINSAKASIDKAAVNEKTAVDASTWVYKAMIYTDLALLDTVSVSAEQTLATAKEDLKKAIDLGGAAQNAGNIERTNNLFAQFELNKGVKAFQTQKFSLAYEAFENSLIYKPSDTTLTYYAGLAAINAQKYTEAIEKYNQLLGMNLVSYSISCSKCDVTYTNKDGGVEQKSDVNSNWKYAFYLEKSSPVSIIVANKNNSGDVKVQISYNGKVIKTAQSSGAFVSASADASIDNLLKATNYSQGKLIALDLSKLYALEKDTVNAIAVASTYATKFNDQALATQEIELSLMSGKQKQVIERILAQIALDPKNKLEYFYLGIAYDALKDFKKAEDAYKKAIELDANYFDATLNLGSGILNIGIDMYNKANTLPANKQKESDIAMKAAYVEFERAFPYLDKAVKIDPKSLIALQNLKTYYVIKKNTAKVAELTKQISALQ